MYKIETNTYDNMFFNIRSDDSPSFINRNGIEYTHIERNPDATGECNAFRVKFHCYSIGGKLGNYHLGVPMSRADALSLIRRFCGVYVDESSEPEQEQKEGDKNKYNCWR